jgi:two-component system, sensor histidine kinase and response regulator
MSNQAQPAIDPAVLEALRQLNQAGEPDVVQEVLTLFVSEAPSRIRAISAAVEAGDPEAVHRSAHTLKGAAGTIGAAALQAECLALEQMGKRNTLQDASRRLEAMHQEYRRVEAEIDQLLSSKDDFSGISRTFPGSDAR